jgi:hypothetical protein
MPVGMAPQHQLLSSSLVISTTVIRGKGPVSPPTYYPQEDMIAPNEQIMTPETRVKALEEQLNIILTAFEY